MRLRISSGSRNAAVQIDGHRAGLGVLATGARFSRAFHTMGIAVDDLERADPMARAK